MTLPIVALFIIIQILDVLTTLKAFKLGGEEAMPLPAFMMDKFGFWPTTFILKGLAIALVVVLATLVTNHYWATVPLCIMGALVLANNTRFILRNR